MKTSNIHEAKTQLSRLLDEASKGESFVIAKARKPIVKVTPLGAPTGAQVRRLGFMAGQISVPDDFDQLGRDEIERIFAWHMKLLLDTHLLLSAAGTPDRLSTEALGLIDNPHHELLFSAASLSGGCD
jgi:antitoxin (DNA-binding transcriptional repressor) of toxin-antitoxin stability system